MSRVCTNLTHHTWKTSPQDGSDVLVVLVLIDLDGTNGMEDKHSVVAACRDICDHSIRALPKSQVLAVAKVVLDIDEAFAGISVREHQTNTTDLSHALSQHVNLREGTVVGDRLVGAVARRDFVLDSRIGADEVREVGLTTAPANTKSADIAAVVSASVGSKRV
jgi:hypothetical protein